MNCENDVRIDEDQALLKQTNKEKEIKRERVLLWSHSDITQYIQKLWV